MDRDVLSRALTSYPMRKSGLKPRVQLLTLTEGLVCHGNLPGEEVELEASENIVNGGDGDETVCYTSLWERGWTLLETENGA